jgi:hypothetical protein
MLPIGVMTQVSYPDGTEYIFYCKRAILFLLSSKILTPHPPLRPASLTHTLQFIQILNN